MSKWLLSFFFIIAASNVLWAQQKNDLEIKGKGPDLFMEHTVVTRESFFSIGRLYNVTPRELADYNHLQLAAGLKVGQHLKVPLVKDNFTQTGDLANGEVLVPVYHHIESGETLYRLGVNYNNVPLTSLKKWNHLSSDEVSLGQAMIVGYLKVKENQSALASRKVSSVSVAQAMRSEEKPVEKKEQQAVAVTTPVVNTPAPAQSENKVTPPQANETRSVVSAVNTKSTIDFAGGYFKNLYDRQTLNKSQSENKGTAGVFKSTSGWQDGKYYCFSNDAMPGTVLKVTDMATGKSVYTKVLDAIPDIKQNSGLSIVISNAASEELGAGDTRFDCTVSFSK
jgi:LysM repeat protein